VFSWQRISTQILSFQIIMKSSSTHFSTANSLPQISCTTEISLSEFSTQLNSQSESELFYANQFVLATKPLRLTTSIFPQLNTCFHSPYVTSSVTRGWACSLQLLLVLASTVILRSDSHGTRDHICLPLELRYKSVTRTTQKTHLTFSE
jgi:hypothetical protein